MKMMKIVEIMARKYGDDLAHSDQLYKLIFLIIFFFFSSPFFKMLVMTWKYGDGLAHSGQL